MAKVNDSVQQILGECKTMVSLTEGSEYLDVSSLSSTLKRQCEELRLMFNEHPDNDHGIRQCKANVEATAIRLEFFMRMRFGDFEERNKLRQYASKLYEDCKNITLSMRDTDDKEKLVEWTDWTRWCFQFYLRSTHIIFNADENDQHMIKLIVEGMQELQERQVSNAG